MGWKLGRLMNAYAREEPEAHVLNLDHIWCSIWLLRSPRDAPLSLPPKSFTPRFGGFSPCTHHLAYFILFGKSGSLGEPLYPLH